MINFISNLPRDLRTGGFSAMNVAAYEALRERFDVHFAGPINPPTILTEKITSKARRVLGIGGDYFFFSKVRLDAIADDVARHIDPSARFDFFHGFTPWIATRPTRPYAAWSDCTFADYVEIFNSATDFTKDDVLRIELLEREWLKQAKFVGFSSQWAAERAISLYGVDEKRTEVFGIFGAMTPPATDEYDGAKQFAFISTDFERKGGAVVLQAFRALRLQFPDARLVVVGDWPKKAAAGPGVEIAGWLRKEDPVQLAKLHEVFASSRAIVNASRSDITPLLLVEAASFGCPSISSRRFAIPEIVRHGETGLLLDRLDSGEMLEAMCAMLDDENKYGAMRRAAWSRARSEHSQERFAERLQSAMTSALALVEPQ